MLSRILIAKEEINISLEGFKGQGDSFLGTNTASNFKLKKVHKLFENPKRLKECTDSILPVLYKQKNKVWMVGNLLIKQFTK